MSDSLIVFQPPIDEPSNIRPSSSASSSRTDETIDRCCHLPLGSVKRRSTHSISSSLIRFTISDALAILVLPCWSLPCGRDSFVLPLRRIGRERGGEPSRERGNP